MGSGLRAGLQPHLGKLKTSILQGFGIGAGLGVYGLVTDGIRAVTEGIGDAIENASSFAESMSKVRVVFGDSSDAVVKWAETAATSMGLSNGAALEATGTLGNLLLSMGQTGEQAASMSMEMVQLAADIASFNNVGVDEVLMAMRSGLTGEIAPLRRFGVNLTEATLKAKAMTLGLSDGIGVLDASAKSTAAYALIMEQTTTAQGDVARTADGLAMTQKTNAALWEDISTEIGTVLLPFMTKLGHTVRDDVLPFLMELVGMLGQIADAIGRLPSLPEELNEKLFGNQEELNARGGALAGTIFDSLADGFHEGTDRLAAIDVWPFNNEQAARQAAEAAKAAVLAMAHELKTGGGLLSRVFGDAIAPTIEVTAQNVAGMAEELRTGSGLLSRIMAGTAKTITEIMEGLGGSVRDAIRSGRDEVKQGMLDLQWAMEHPRSGQRYADWLKDMVADAERKRAQAQRSGNAVAVAQANALLRDLSAKYNAIAGLSGTITTTVTTRGFDVNRSQHRGRAEGGPVWGGQQFMVGERGPEILSMAPGTSGWVTPNGAMPGGDMTVTHKADPSLISALARAGLGGGDIADFLRNMGREGGLPVAS